MQVTESDRKKLKTQRDQNSFKAKHTQIKPSPPQPIKDMELDEEEDSDYPEIVPNKVHFKKHKKGRHSNDRHGNNKNKPK
jgi:hypothetical protein